MAGGVLSVNAGNPAELSAIYHEIFFYASRNPAVSGEARLFRRTPGDNGLRKNAQKKPRPPEGRRGRGRAFGGSDVREVLPEEKEDARPEAGGGEALFQ